MKFSSVIVNFGVFNLFTDRDKRSTTPSPSPGIEETTQGTCATCSYQSSAVALAIIINLRNRFSSMFFITSRVPIRNKEFSSRYDEIMMK